MSDRKSPLDRALDLFVYAPLGLAVTARDELPRLIERGRQQLQGQMTVARMMGEYAVGEGQKEAERRIKQAADTLASLSGSDGSSGTPSAASPPEPAAAGAPSPASSAAASTPTAAAAPASPASPAPSAEGLAIPGYDSLSASQVVQRLAGLSPDELAAVQRYESATRGRKTILNRIDQLRAGPVG